MHTNGSVHHGNCDFGHGPSASTRKWLRAYEGEDECIRHNFMDKCTLDELGMEFLHAKQIIDLLALRIRVVDDAWYSKPRSTCWFCKYLYKIYTPDMFYDIMRMKRMTFDRLVRDLVSKFLFVFSLTLTFMWACWIMLSSG